MKTAAIPNDTQFVLFGAEGDLSWRLVLPALFNLFLDGHLSQRFHLLAVGRSDSDDAALVAHYLAGITEHSRRGAPRPQDWQAFSGMIRYVNADLTVAEDFKKLAGLMNAQDTEWGVKADRIFYLHRH